MILACISIHYTLLNHLNQIFFLNFLWHARPFSPSCLWLLLEQSYQSHFPHLFVVTFLTCPVTPSWFSYHPFTTKVIYICQLFYQPVKFWSMGGNLSARGKSTWSRENIQSSRRQHWTGLNLECWCYEAAALMCLGTMQALLNFLLRTNVLTHIDNHSLTLLNYNTLLFLFQLPCLRNMTSKFGAICSRIPHFNPFTERLLPERR